MTKCLKPMYLKLFSFLHYFEFCLRCFCKQGGEQNLLLLYSKGTLPLMSTPQKKQQTKTGVVNPEEVAFASRRLSAANAL